MSKHGLNSQTKRPLHRSTWLLLIWVLFSSIGHAYGQERPCWLSQLTFDNQKFMYGAANKFSASLLPPMHFSRLNALNNWAGSEGLDKVTVKQDLTKLKQFKVQGHKVYFLDEYEDKDAVYSLVSDSPEWPPALESQTCAIKTCKPESCSPSWLCQPPAKEGQVFGISAPTSHPNGQLRHAIENVQTLVRTVNQSMIKGRVKLLNIDTTQYHQANIQQEFQITDLDHSVRAVKVNNLCHYKGNLVSQILFKQIDLPVSQNWLEYPNLGDLSGVVGHAKGQTSTGRLSDLLSIAVRRGLFELAKAKNITVDNRLEIRTHSQGSFNLVRVSEQETESVISAFIADIKMELNDNIQPEIYIWLLENKGEL